LKPVGYLIVLAFAAMLACAAVLVVGSGQPDALVLETDSAVEGDPDPPPSPRSGFEHVRAFLAAIPDPKNLVTAANGAPLTFARSIMLRHFRGERIVAGTVELRSGDQTLGLFQSWMELVPVDAGRFVLHRAWHGPEIEIVVVSVEALRPLSVPDLAGRAQAIAGGEEPFALDEATCAEARIPRDLEPGDHPMELPACLRDVEELLVMYPSTRAAAPNRAHVMRIRPREGLVTVIEPEERAFRRIDEGHAPVRLFREPRTRRAVGDGLRVGAFVLNEAMTAVEVWLD
jgi:hypothetical protein